MAGSTKTQFCLAFSERRRRQIYVCVKKEWDWCWCRGTGGFQCTHVQSVNERCTDESDSFLVPWFHHLPSNLSIPKVTYRPLRFWIARCLTRIQNVCILTLHLIHIQIIMYAVAENKIHEGIYGRSIILHIALLRSLAAFHAANNRRATQRSTHALWT